MFDTIISFVFIALLLCLISLATHRRKGFKMIKSACAKITALCNDAEKPNDSVNKV